MMHTTTGQHFVYAVFDADGYECETLLALFDDEQRAERFVAARRAEAEREYRELRIEKTIPMARTIEMRLIEVQEGAGT